MKTFRDYYKFPLKPMGGLEQLKVLTDDNKMAFDWTSKYSKETINKFIEVINGTRKNDTIDHFKYNSNTCCVYFYGILGPRVNLLRIRGWGMLTDNPYHLSEDKAKEIQDSFGNYIVKQLNSH